MKALAKFIVALADLVEAEGRTLRRTLLNAALAVLAVAVAAALLFVALGLQLCALYLVLAGWVGEAGAGALVGLVALGLAGVLVWIGKRLTR